MIHPHIVTVNRWDFDIPRAKALMRLSMLMGEAMLHGMNDRGIPVERINFQDNGNWAIDMPGSPRPSGPHFHLHLYGRARGSQFQKHGEALSFHDRDSDFWKQSPLKPLDPDDLDAIDIHLQRLLKEERYQLDQWGLTED